MTNNEAITHVPYLKWVVISLRCGIDPDSETYLFLQV